MELEKTARTPLERELAIASLIDDARIRVYFSHVNLL
jgi:hypothetical protein